MRWLKKLIQKWCKECCMSYRPRPDYLLCNHTGGDSPPAVTGGDIEFDNLIESKGDSISLNTSNGEITLKAGRAYELIGHVHVNGPFVDGSYTYQWRISGGALIGVFGQINHETGGGNTQGTHTPDAIAIVEATGASDVVVTLEITGTGLTGLGNTFGVGTYAKVKEL